VSNHTHQTAPTQFIETNGIRYAYRRFGKKDGLPLVFIPHILGNLDSWDPSVTDGLTQSREVILFDNAGIASSSGEVPTTFAEMAKSAGLFLDALGIVKADLLGFSIGSTIAQNVALQRPSASQVGARWQRTSQWRRHSGNPGIAGHLHEQVRKPRRFLDRWLLHRVPGKSGCGPGIPKAQRCARGGSRHSSQRQGPACSVRCASGVGKAIGERFGYLQNIKIPVLVVGGKSDIIFYTINSFYPEQNLPNAQLIVYPDAAHGSLFQYPALFVEHTSMFLRG
jgi:pimeloyl-ACP methyl ester carboxylesterase